MTAAMGSGHPEGTFRQRADAAIAEWRDLRQSVGSAAQLAGDEMVRVLRLGADHINPIVPELVHVTGHRSDGRLRQGLACPRCHTVVWDGDEAGIIVVDRSEERESTFGYTVTAATERPGPVASQGPNGKGHSPAMPTGRNQQRAITGSYGSRPDLHTLRYECRACGKRVALPRDVIELGT